MNIINGLIEKAAAELAESNQLVVIGRSAADSALELIPSGHWSFLKVDFEKNEARALELYYAGLRFVPVSVCRTKEGKRILELDYKLTRKQSKKRQMVEPENKSDWFYVIRDCVQEFESEYGYTPNSTQL